MAARLPLVSALVSLILLACAGGQSEAEAPESEPPPPAVAPPPPAEHGPPGVVERPALVRFLDAGFPRFLQMVEVEPSLENGQFRGWTIVALHPPEFWQGVDLKPGDVVTSVNGMPLERETEAFDAFQAMRGASRISVSYSRGGKPRSLELQVIDSGKASAPAASSGSAAPSAASSAAPAPAKSAPAPGPAKSSPSSQPGTPAAPR